MDLAHNFVLADAGCNSRKSDLLADVPFLERWQRRNDDAKDDLASRFTALHLPYDYEVSRQVTGWAYAQVEQTRGQGLGRGEELQDVGAGVAGDHRRVAEAGLRRGFRARESKNPSASEQARNH